MEFTETKNAAAAIGPYSQATVVNGFVFTSGQIALTKNGDFIDGDVAQQLEQVLCNLNNILIASKSSIENIVKTTIYLTNIDDFGVVNKIYEEFFKNHKPARSTVEVSALPKNAKIEIEAIATLK